MSEMVEKVARALVGGGHLGVSLAFTEPQETDKGSIPLLRQSDTAKALAAARAAIEAMREPTDAMGEAGERAIYDLEPYIAHKAYEAMIDAALTPAAAPSPIPGPSENTANTSAQPQGE